MIARRATFALLPLALAISGCAVASGPASAPAVAASEIVSDRLYLGRSRADGAEVSEEEWARFVAEVVTPRFPEGLTLWRAEGQWRGETGEIVTEGVFVVELIHPRSEATDRAVDEVAAEYKRRFRQEAVMHLRAAVDARFLE